MSIKTIGQIIKYLGIYFVSFVLILFAISKFLNAQFQIWNYTQYVPLKDLDLFSHAWSFFGRSYNYNFFIGLTEITAAILILFNRTRLIGLLLAAGIYTNVLIVDIEFNISDAILHATIEFIIVLLLLIPYLKDLKKFFWDMGGRLTNQPSANRKNLKLILPIIFIITTSTVATIFLKQAISSQDKIIGSYKISEFIVSGDTLTIGQGKYSKDPMLFFEFGNASVLSLNDSSYRGNYSIKADSVFINLYKDFKNIRTIKATVNKGFTVIKGTTDKGEPVEIEINKIRVESSRLD